MNIFQKAKQILVENGWMKGDVGSAYEKSKHCIMGALGMAATNGRSTSYEQYSESVEAIHTLRELLVARLNDGVEWYDRYNGSVTVDAESITRRSDFCVVAAWNNDPARTVEDVYALLDEAAALELVAA